MVTLVLCISLECRNSRQASGYQSAQKTEQTELILPQAKITHLDDLGEIPN